MASKTVPSREVESQRYPGSLTTRTGSRRIFEAISVGTLGRVSANLTAAFRIVPARGR